MRHLRLTTFIEAIPEVVFDLCLDVDIHTESTGAREEIIGGITTGVMGLGDEVTWRAWHFRLPWTMTSKITEYEKPRFFVDEQQKGPFHSWWHRHEFREVDGGTEMTDEVRYASPAGPLGGLVDRVFLERYMRRLLERRNVFVKREAERR